MDAGIPSAFIREGLLLLGTAGGPLFATLLISGLAVGVIQATTQIHDPAVGFIPRAAAAIAVCWALGGWMLEQYATFLTQAIEHIATPF